MKKLSLDRLNPSQREAVLHGDGPLLVLAGAGSGKTSTMTYRIAHLIAERGVPATKVLGLSFTNKAANELRGRVRELVGKAAGPKAAEGLIVSTFHSLCVRILRRFPEKLGYRKNFTIFAASDQEDLLREILRSIKIDDRRFKPSWLLFRFGQAKSRFMDGSSAESFLLEGGSGPDDYAIAATSAFPKYQERLKLLNAMDFDDLLSNAVKLLEEHDDVRTALNKRFQYILVDEYQDTNAAQFRLLRLLTERTQNLCVVGDDDQSIYGWRGAEPSHILEFADQFDGASTVTLDRNYRSTTTILDAANAVISKNRVRHAKKLWSDRGKGDPIQELALEDDPGEADAVAEEILALGTQAREGKRENTRPWKDFAVLYRSNSQSRIFEEALRRAAIPYKIVGGMSFLDRREIKSVLAYWRLVVNSRDDASARRVINWPPRGIGRASIEAANARAVAEGTSFFDALGAGEGLSAKAREGARTFRDTITSLRASLDRLPADPQSLARWARESLDRIGLRTALEADADGEPPEAAAQIPRRFENAEELAHSLGRHPIEEPDAGPVAVLRDFLQALALEAQDAATEDGEKAEKDQVALLTLHAAKGLEFPIVFLVGMEDGLLPHQRVIDEAQDLSEERRLCYVGITRAKDRLYLTRARNRIRYGKAVPRNPSRFLAEIPPDLRLGAATGSAGAPAGSPEAVARHEERVKSFLSGIRANLEQASGSGHRKQGQERDQGQGR